MCKCVAGTFGVTLENMGCILYALIMLLVHVHFNAECTTVLALLCNVYSMHCGSVIAVACRNA